MTQVIALFYQRSQFRPMKKAGSGDLKLWEPVISEFITAQGELSLALAEGSIPYAASCFYAPLEEKGWLVFKSEPHTEHIRIAKSNPDVAGTIVERNRLPGIIKGIQFRGRLFQPGDDEMLIIADVYYRKYPFARVFKGEFWVVEPVWIKMTDNTPLVGKKRTWEKPV